MVNKETTRLIEGVVDRLPIIFIGAMVLVAFTLLDQAGILPGSPPTLEERCTDACADFNLQYHYSSTVEINRCWCIDSGGLPREVPVK